VINLSTDTINKPVLVLNQDYRPINICRARRAVVLALQGKAEVMENGRGEVHSVNYTVPLPSVIRLVYLVRRPPIQRKLTRVEIFSRDRYICQYCGKETKELTLDHIIPRYQEGEHTWENVVGCCVRCNRRKAGRTPSEAGMKLIRQPFAPRPTSFSVPHRYLSSHIEWQKFLGEAS
jgi:5-methylcytosine-specific restriction endonuclease McrA